jgi:general secretion pathway protein D
MKNKFNSLISLLILLSISNLSAQDSFILNYENVDIKKVTQDIAQFSKRQLF